VQRIEAADADRTVVASRIRLAILAVACGLPVIVLALVFKLGVNVPFSDEWDWTPLVYAAHHGTLTLDMLWAQDNEHRMFFGKLLVVALSAIGGWNVVREEIVSVVLCAASQLVLWRLLSRTVPTVALPLTFFAASLLLWNLGQAENFAMGQQMSWFLLELGLLVAVWRLTVPGNAIGDVLVAGTAATVASYCSAIGLLVWPVGLCAIALARNSPRRMAVVWICWGAAVYALYRAGLAAVSLGHVDIVQNLPSLAVYCLVYLGLPLAFWSRFYGCIATGALLVAILVIIVARDLKLGDRRLFARSAAWYALALFAVLGAIGTGPNRLGFGLDYAVTSTRYILVASWLPISIAALVAMRWPNALDVRHVRATPAAACFIAAVAMTSVSWARGTRDWQYFSHARRADVRAIREHDFSNFAPYFPDRARLMVEVREFQEVESRPTMP